MKNTPNSSEFNNCKATNHAYMRAKKRLRWRKEVLDKMMIVAFDTGIQHRETKGRLRNYLDKLWLDYKTCNNLRIHGEVIYFFRGKLLITLYRIDNRFLNHLRKLR